MLTINNTFQNNYNNRKPSFNAVKIAADTRTGAIPDKIFNAVLSSKTIQKIIKDDAKKGNDTFIGYRSIPTSFMEPYKDELVVNDQIRITARSTQYGTHLIENMINEIRDLDYVDSLETTIAKVKKFCKDIKLASEEETKEFLRSPYKE